MSTDNYNKEDKPAAAKEDFKNFQEFYPFYLSQHAKPLTKLFHFVGSAIGLGVWGTYFHQLFQRYYEEKTSVEPIHQLILGGFVCGYFFAWVSHFFIEKNKPATFKYPLWSLRGDFRMFFEILAGKHRIFP